MTTARPSRTSSRRSPSSSGSTRTGKSSSTATSTPSAPGRNAPASPSRTDHAPLGAPLFVLNLKVYPNCLGPGAAKIGTALAKESHRLGISVAICPSAPDLGTLAALLPVPVLAQHVDPEDPGAHTGSIVAEALAASGVSGSLLNHSEHPMAEDDLGRVVAHLQSLGLVPVVCAKDVDDSRLARPLPTRLPRRRAAGADRGRPLGRHGPPGGGPGRRRGGPGGFPGNPRPLWGRSPGPERRPHRPRARGRRGPRRERGDAGRRLRRGDRRTSCRVSYPPPVPPSLNSSLACRSRPTPRPRTWSGSTSAARRSRRRSSTPPAD